MCRKIVTAIFIVACFVIQCSVFGNIAYTGIIPNLMIILISSFGFMRGEKEGLVIGFICGLLNDVFFGELLGFYALILMYIGYINGKFCHIFYPQDIKLPLALIITSDLSYGIICYILLFMFRGKFQFSYYFTSVILPEALYTIVITLFLYPLILKVNEKLEIRERRSEQKFV